MLVMGITQNTMNPPAYSRGIPGKVISFYSVPLDPAYEAGLAGHVPATVTNHEPRIMG
jgi:hypothetical protein